MPEPKTTNKTRLACTPVYGLDEAGRPVVAAVVKGTFQINDNGTLSYADKQVPVNLEGKYYAQPECSSYIHEPETAFIKLSTDVIVHGYAQTGKTPAPVLPVDIRVGGLHKPLQVYGNRYWQRQSNRWVKSSPEPFDRIALIYEHAFGGSDRRHADPKNHLVEAHNTVGKGLYHPDIPTSDRLPLPNIEDPAQPIEAITDRPVPAGCGFTLPHWEPRKSLAGTYDEQWKNKRSPLLPLDFNRAFFNAASPGLIADGYLQGNEPVRIVNMTPGRPLEFYLPNLRPPICEIELKDSDEILTTRLDTVIVNTSAMQLTLIWRDFLTLPRSHHDVVEITVNHG